MVGLLLGLSGSRGAWERTGEVHAENTTGRPDFKKKRAYERRLDLRPNQKRHADHAALRRRVVANRAMADRVVYPRFAAKERGRQYRGRRQRCGASTAAGRPTQAID